ncbi:hypothetical protein [Absidia glauca]|uniref:Uncharacterized protein n=1 Tax=Absidia glauca TaxID=4829 RepID=A0A168LXK8_ABSGL|nr:hypothetical protein [Absidia glauca]
MLHQHSFVNSNPAFQFWRLAHQVVGTGDIKQWWDLHRRRRRQYRGHYQYSCRRRRSLSNAGKKEERCKRQNVNHGKKKDERHAEGESYPMFADQGGCIGSESFVMRC